MALIIKTGEFTGTSFDTGLSSIKLVTFYRKSINSKSGCLSAAYHEATGCQYTGVTYSQYLSTIAYGYSTTSFSINEGIVTFDISGNNGIASGETYTWIAVGEE